MLPIDIFLETWSRCDHLSVIHGYLAGNASSVLQPDEILRAEWVARVSALDLFIHELVTQRMVEIFEGKISSCPGFSGFNISLSVMDRIRSATSPSNAVSAFDLTVREYLSRRTFQYPDDIAAGVRLCSDVALWNEVAGALRLKIPMKSKEEGAKIIKNELSQIVGRRNKIVHEGDLQPTMPRTPWPIKQSDVEFVTNFIKDIVYAVRAVV